MQKSFKYFCVALLVTILSGCNRIDTYFVYGPQYLAELERDLGGASADPETRKTIEVLLNATQIRVAIQKGNRNTLVVHKSYKQTDALKKVGGSFDFSSDIQKYPDCDYFDDDNWVCENFFAMKYEMREGKLFIGGREMQKKYSFKL